MTAPAPTGLRLVAVALTLHPATPAGRAVTPGARLVPAAGRGVAGLPAAFVAIAFPGSRRVTPARAGGVALHACRAVLYVGGNLASGVPPPLPRPGRPVRRPARRPGPQPAGAPVRGPAPVPIVPGIVRMLFGFAEPVRHARRRRLLLLPGRSGD